MYGTTRLGSLVASGDDLIEGLLTSLEQFTGAGWEQEDDITLVTLHRAAEGDSAGGLKFAFRIASRPGNEREAMERVGAGVAPLGLGPRRLEQLKTAVAEAAMNAIEYGNEGREEIPVEIEVEAAGDVLVVRIADSALGGPVTEAETPDLDAKLAGLQKPRGWGLYLIENMVDELRVSDANGRHTVELVLNLEGGGADGGR
jgi:anti-sigma regulatory factor (Ser/Thr protein kinase)